MLDEDYLSTLEPGEAVRNPDHAARWTTPKRETVGCQATRAGEKGDYMLSFLTSSYGWDGYDNLLVSVLVDALLGGPANPLYSALTASRLGKDLCDQSGMSADFNEIPFSVGLCGVDEERKEELEAFILDTIARIAKEGIGDDIIEASIRRQEFLLQEMPGGIPNGLRMFLKCIRAWDRNLDLGDALDMSGKLRQLRADLEKEPRLFEHWMTDNLVNNAHRLSLSVKPVPDLIAKEDEFLRQEFLKKKKEAPAVVREDESIPPVDGVFIPSVSPDDIKESEAAIKAEDMGNGIIFESENTSSITYISLIIDLSDKSSDELIPAVLLSRYILMAGVKGEDASVFHRRLRLESGGYYAYLETGRACDGEVKAFFVLRIKCLSRQSGICLTLLEKWIRSLNMDDAENCINAM